MKGSLLGPEYDASEIRESLTQYGLKFDEAGDEGAFLSQVAHELAKGKVVGWFQGRMEYGPRALGSRSILGDPQHPEMQAQMNLRIKFRESFRPFAPSILAEDTATYFDLEQPSPYMLLVAQVKEARRLQLDSEQLEAQKSADLLQRVNVVRSDIPAVTHVDYSARVQTVDERHGRFHRLLQAFKAETGCPVLINTSFNVRGEPIVCTPEDAIQCFLATEMDVLAIGNVLVRKAEQASMDRTSRKQHLARFELD